MYPCLFKCTQSFLKSIEVVQYFSMNEIFRLRYDQTFFEVTVKKRSFHLYMLQL